DNDHLLTTTATDASGTTGAYSNSQVEHDKQTASGTGVNTTTQPTQTHDASLVVNGTAEAGSTVELFDGAASLGTVTANGAGAWRSEERRGGGEGCGRRASAAEGWGIVGAAGEGVVWYVSSRATGAQA